MPRDGRTPSVGCMFSGLGIIAALCAGVFVLDAATDGASPTTTTTSVATTTVPASTTTPPTSVAIDQPAQVAATVPEYTVVYRVELLSGGAVIVDTEVRRHRFPFESEVVVFAGEPDELAARAEPTVATERSVHVMGGVETGPPTQTPSLLSVVPGLPAQLGHFAGDLDRAVDEGLVEPMGVRMRIADRDCDLYRTRSPVDVERLEAPTPDDNTELCIAPDGLVLREVWSVGGDVFRRRTAVSVDVEPVDPTRFSPTGYRIPDASGGGRVRELTADSTVPGEPHLLPDTLPDGFTSTGRYVYVADAFQTEAGQAQVDRVASIVDVFRGGGHVLVVENGGDLDGRVAVPEGGIGVDVDGAPDAVAFLTTRGSQVFVPVDGRFVRLTSTLPLAAVVELASQLTDHPGTGEVTPISDELDITGRIAREDLESHDHDGSDTGSESEPAEHSHDGSTHTHG